MLALVDDEAQALRVVKLAMDDVELLLGARFAGSLQAKFHKQAIGKLTVKISLPEWLTIELLSLTKSEMTVYVLIEMLEDAGDKLSEHIAHALENIGNINSPQAITALASLLKFEGFGIRKCAAKALTKIETEDSQARLLAALENDYYFLCLSILRGIESSGERKIIRDKVITTWSQRQIFPGDEPTQVINQQLNTADIILLLISANSLADDTCYNLEIQRAIERHQAGEARVIPILLRPVDWAGAPFSHLRSCPKNRQPLVTWANQDKIFSEIAAHPSGSTDSSVAICKAS